MCLDDCKEYKMMPQNCPALISLSSLSAFSVPGSSLKSSLKIEYALHAMKR